MKEFIAKFGDQINGVLSGFDRLVFRGHLRGISYESGMKNYLWANRVLNKEFGEHAEKTTKVLKEASLAEARRLQRPIQYLASSKVSKERGCSCHRRQGRHCQRTGMRADERGVMPQLRHFQEPGDEEAGLGDARPALLVPVSLLDASSVRIHERAHPKLVSVSHPDLLERKGVVGTADGWCGAELPAAGQLLCLGGGLGASARTIGRPTEGGLAAAAACDCRPTQTHAC